MRKRDDGKYHVSFSCWDIKPPPAWKQCRIWCESKLPSDPRPARAVGSRGGARCVGGKILSLSAESQVVI